jgi:hypothetical protein
MKTFFWTLSSASGHGHSQYEEVNASFCQGCLQMPGMRRADRRTSNDDNAIQRPQAKRAEPPLPNDIKNLLSTVRSQRDEAKDQVV